MSAPAPPPTAHPGLAHAGEDARGTDGATGKGARPTLLGAGGASLPRTFPAEAMDALPVALLRVDAQGRLLAVNQAFLHLLGVEQEGAVPRDLQGLLAEPAQLAWWFRAAREHGEVSLRLVFAGAAGRRVATWVTMCAAGPGEIVALVRADRAEPARGPPRTDPRDVERALHLGEEWSRAVVDAADQLGIGLAISQAAPDGEPRLVFLNDAGADILGRRRESAAGGPAFPALDAEAEAHLRDRVRTPAGAGEAPRILTTMERDGQERDIEVGLGTGDYWGRPAVFAFFRDVTRERELERAERTAREQLIERLEESARFKTHLLNTAAHELFTPLTPIAMQVDMLKESGMEGGERQRRAVDILDRNVHRLLRLLTDLLDVSRLQGGRLPLSMRPVDLVSVLQETLDMYAETAQRREVELALDAPPAAIAEADPDRVQQVLSNLVGNALKFTPPGGRITLRLTPGETACLVQVVDSGAGFAPEDATRLFEAFSQLDAEHGGTGLGLFISRGIVERHGGRIWAESAGPGTGATFSFTLPASAAREPPTRAA
ncbi:MAG: PAS domain-containing sensor histidine kinase [Halobacteriales archaeon]|nr:PAS domain-containing sensor histidine kinase [Halobacteriales archaeon]